VFVAIAKIIRGQDALSGREGEILFKHTLVGAPSTGATVEATTTTRKSTSRGASISGGCYYYYIRTEEVAPFPARKGPEETRAVTMAMARREGPKEDSIAATSRRQRRGGEKGEDGPAMKIR
jgi:hypothetical protein